ncbi:vacuolar protein sorting-associated protein 41 [Basidiobolus meristosporus CBS 931.73]|uniref:Vacuolar protein sorting-associated protein 41 n=1 Tax=Basidiobolus meristosporus CBS 931.73 TaxID=1314790 RepID=A0A1Y1Z482_9FUNG|nr:vacuolar protein sorting-associated protein 41 [Basidiobolus meristosporus CBS 931.73]|eukprot:ORY04934.1 vacuolar protein sorting-associated protein 41 [Basidiobolus meristosporus CBS 931.73]
MSASENELSPAQEEEQLSENSSYISEEYSEYSEEYDDDEEPKLKYQRIGADVSEIFTKDTVSIMKISERFMVLGTHWGMVHIMDFNGNEVKKFRPHSATINSLSIDEHEEYVATASDDGKVLITGLYNDEISAFNYMRPVKCIALDPEFSKKSARQFVSGGMAGQLIMNQKGWLGHKDTIIHGGEGPIYALEWRGDLIAWANDTGVKIYDTTSNQRITYIDRPAQSPRADLYRCHLCWKTEKTLLIGWADSVKVAVVKEKTIYSPVGLRFRTDFIVAGIAPFADMLLLLTYVSDTIQQKEDDTDVEQHKRKIAAPPELRLINSDNEEVSSDVLSMVGHEYYQPNDYILDFFPSEDLFYVASPKDIVVAKLRDLEDHVTWLLERQMYEEALEAVQGAEERQSGEIKSYDSTEIGQTYIHYLMEDGDYEKAASVCPKVLKNDPKLWEKWVFSFAEAKELKVISPQVPTENPQLSSTVYEMILAYFLNTDHELFNQTIKTWPSSLYDIQNVIVAVEDALSKEGNNTILMDALAELYNSNRQLDKALEYYLRLRRPDVFELIKANNLFSSVQDKVVLLMDFDQYLLEKEEIESAGKDNEESSTKRATRGPAVQLLVEHVHSIPIQRVVQQLTRHPKYLHIYLDAIFDKDAHLAYEFHDLQVELYAEYDYPRLLDFLKASNYYSLEKAYAVCEQRDLVPEMVFILGRIGNNHKALMLIIKRLGDVNRAIEFAKEQNDEELWEDLLKYSMDKPDFIRGLLENVGAQIDPVRLIRTIPEGMEIPGLKDLLIKILQDYNVQLSLRQGCERVLTTDSSNLSQRLQKVQRRAISCSGKPGKR